MSVLQEVTQDGIMVLTLNRPEKLNALDTPSKQQLGDLWDRAARDPDIRVILLRGAGKKAFCAGSDIKEIQRTGQMVSTETLMRAIPSVGIALNKPTIAALHGFTRDRSRAKQRDGFNGVSRRRRPQPRHGTHTAVDA